MKFFIEDFHNNLEKHRDVAEKFCLSEDDGELADIPPLLHPTDSFIHNSFWGLARGPTAAQAVLFTERKSVAYTWTTPLIPLTSRTFVRHGYIRFLPGYRQLLHEAKYSNSTWSALIPHFSSNETLSRMGEWTVKMLSNSPFAYFSSLKRSMFQKKVTEYVVVRDGCVVYRDVGLDWCMAKQ